MPKNPLVITATGAVTLNRPIRPTKVYWFNPTTAGHLLTITDDAAAPSNLLEARAEANNGSQVFDFPHRPVWKALNVTTLGSGSVYIFHD